MNRTTDTPRAITLLVGAHGVENMQTPTTTKKKRNNKNVPTPIIPNTRVELFVSDDTASSVPLLISTISRWAEVVRCNQRRQNKASNMRLIADTTFISLCPLLRRDLTNPVTACSDQVKELSQFDFKMAVRFQRPHLNFFCHSPNGNGNLTV